METTGTVSFFGMTRFVGLGCLGFRLCVMVAFSRHEDVRVGSLSGAEEFVAQLL